MHNKTIVDLWVIGGLNRFISAGKRSIMFRHAVSGHPSVKDTVEALGIPHTEIKAILVNGAFVNFHYQIQGGERIRVYPHEHPLRRPYIRLRPPPLRPIKFICDVHLGKLAHHLRLLGFDTYYGTDLEDSWIIRLANRQRRIILTRDIGILKNKKVVYGHFVRHTRPDKQIKEIIARYALTKKCRPFRRCMQCNGNIKAVAKKNIIHLLPPKTKYYYRTFYQCGNCGRIYWRGPHYADLLKKVHRYL